MGTPSAHSAKEGPAGIGREFARVPKLVRISKTSVLEAGAYWPELRPHFSNPDYRRLRYALLDRVPDAPDRPHLSFRGAASVDALDLAFIADRYAAALGIAGEGLPDYCLTFIRTGGLVCAGLPGTGDLRMGRGTGLIYRGRPGTTLTASGSHERIAIWIPAATLHARLSGLLGEPVQQDVEFQPIFDWNAPAVRSLKGLVTVLIDEFCQERRVLTLDIAARSFTDLFLYTLLQSVPHSYSDRLERPAATVQPRTMRRAEAFIEANVEGSIALHDVASAAGCSVRSLQEAFRQFRATTPQRFIRAARLHAARETLLAATPGTTVTSVALHYGFSNAGRFTSLFRQTFGISPAEMIRDAHR